MTFLSIGMKECVNLDIPGHIDDEPGLRRNRMKVGQLWWALALRCIVFTYAVICPFLLILGPFGLHTKKSKLEISDGTYQHYVAEVVIGALAALIALITACLVMDATRRLMAMRMRERQADEEMSVSPGKAES